jgi:bifunctional non-homologous end joining protein LigD
MSDRIPFRVKPMLATLVQKPLNSRGWVYEEKYDGYRILAYKEGSRITLLSRNAKDRTDTFSGIAKAVASLAPRTLLLDGEAVAFDRKRVSRFQLLQNGKSEPAYAVFDCLYVNGRDLRRQPLSERRASLEKVIRQSPEIFTSARLSQNGFEAYKLAQRKGYEGVLAKEKSAPYIEGRSAKWLNRAGRLTRALRRASAGSLRSPATSLRRQGRDRVFPGFAGSALQEIPALGSQQPLFD